MDRTTLYWVAAVALGAGAAIAGRAYVRRSKRLGPRGWLSLFVIVFGGAGYFAKLALQASVGEQALMHVLAVIGITCIVAALASGVVAAESWQRAISRTAGLSALALSIVAAGSLLWVSTI